VLAGRQILVERLMHVPEDRDTRHNGPAAVDLRVMRILDRYVIREVLWPFAIGLVITTFLFIIPVLITVAEELVAKGVPAHIIVRLMWHLVPQSLGLTIPMSLLFGLLIGFGRLSADREFVAMQACGVGVLRLLRPVALLSVAASASSAYVLLVSVPSGNQTYREIVFGIVADRAESNVKPRVFFDDFPNLILYVRDVPPTGGWQGVFMADDRPGQERAIYLARRGRVAIDRSRRTAEMVLEDGTRHTADTAGKYEVFSFKQQVIKVNPETMFARAGPEKGEREMTVAELRTRIADLERRGDSAHNARMEVQKKFSIPFACIVFGLMGLALGASNRRDGRLASFVIGIGVIFVYYVLLWLGMAMAKGHMVAPWLGVWLPNLVLMPLGCVLFAWRERAADQPIQVKPPNWVLDAWTRLVSLRPRAALGVRLPRLRLPLPSLLDRYVVVSYLRAFALAFVALIGLFYIAAFLDHSDKVFKGQATWLTLVTYFVYQTPEYVYYVIPLSVLLATLVTIGLLTKNSEIIVMKACGISLYRVALPLLLCALAAGATLFALEQSILGPWTRRAYAIRHVMRGLPPQTFDVLERQWLAGTNGDIYHYAYFDPRKQQLAQLSIYQFEGQMSRLERRVFAERAMFLRSRNPAQPGEWHAEQGWVREFASNGDTERFSSFAESRLAMEPASYFETQQPEPKYMSYSQLKAYVARLRSSGFDVGEQEVALARKISFPFVTLIMTLLAVPFAVTTGRRGAMYGIGAGIVLAIAYWVAISVFGALGSGGLVAPSLAAWAPNLLFGAGAAYLVLTVRT
jgi:LPS export ABC transporter permease LptG/LPS export ABC transporter permease LptF